MAYNRQFVLLNIEYSDVLTVKLKLFGELHYYTEHLSFYTVIEFKYMVGLCDSLSTQIHCDMLFVMFTCNMDIVVLNFNVK